MTKTNLLTVFVVTLVVAMLGVASVTPVFAAPVLNPANGHHYELISTILSWTDAKNAAASSVFQGVNGHLVTITSADENVFVESIVPDSTIVWIGFTDEVSEGTFEWVTGEPVAYTNWGATEPNDAGSGEDYAEFQSDPPSTGSPWNDVPNVRSGNSGYVVEYDTDPVHSGMFDILEEILDEVKAIWDAIQNDVIPLLEGIDTTVNNIEPSVRDNLFVTDVHLKDGQVMVLLDNAGIGGSSDVEVTWRLDETKCQLLYTLTDVGAGLTLTPFVDGAELGGNPAHEDLSGVEAIALTTQNKKNCHVNPTQGEYIGISTVGSTP